MPSASRSARVTRAVDGGHTRFTIRLDGADWNPHEPTDLDGLTLPAADPESAVVTVNGRPVEDLVRLPAGATGYGLVALPWRRLEFPAGEGRRT